MSAMAAVVTPKGLGAIATIKLHGISASGILRAVFQPSNAVPAPGAITVGRITDGSHVIDQVVLACEMRDSFAINCHGSPLVVEIIVELLARHGAALVEPQTLIGQELRRQSTDYLAVEAALTQLESLTVEGTKLIANQLTSGLSPLAHRWLKSLSDKSLEAVESEAAAIIARSSVARFVILGARVVLAGPANSGKSTLLNCLTGRTTSISADVPGTTRDYVSARFTSASLCIEVVDTAGLDDSTAPMGSADRAAQETSRRLLESADLVILVLDSTRPAWQFDSSILGGRPTVTVLNKCDLVPLSIPGTIPISATLGENIEAVVMALRQRLGIDSLDLTAPVCFTQRQEDILRRLVGAADITAAQALITELINGPSSV